MDELNLGSLGSLAGLDAISDEAECHRFYLVEELTEETKRTFVPALRKAVAEGPETIEIFIDTNGGHAYACFDIVALIEKAKRQGTIVKTIVPAFAASAGSMVAVTGTKGYRYISSMGEHYIHYGSYGLGMVTNPVELDRDYARERRWQANIMAHYQKYAKIPQIKTKFKDDHLWVPADEAIKWGLADKNIEEW